MRIHLSFTVLFADTGEIDGTPIDVALPGLVETVRPITNDLDMHLP